MKETISVNLASQAFTFDKDAYRLFGTPVGKGAAGDAAPGTGRRFVDLGLYPVVDRRTQRSQTARREFPVGRIRDSPETARGKGCVFPICGPDPELKHEIRNSMYKQR